MDEEDAKLEAQAQAMAEKALAALPAEARIAKIGKVKEGILKQLKAKAKSPAGGVSTAVPPKSAGAPAMAVPLVAAVVRPPAVPPPPMVIPQVEMLPGIAMCGDELWFGDHAIRQRLQYRIIAAHAEQKILVGPPREEIKRICPGGGRVLGAAGVLRLGGTHLGGYGESDIAYAYRQLSRALHPDKNQGIPEAADAFKRLTDAADELRQHLTETRNVLKSITDAVGGSVTEEALKRPQEALFAEASRILYAVLGLTGEGEVPEVMLERAASRFSVCGSMFCCDPQVFLSLWYDTPHIIECFASVPVRTAFDCSPKHLRAQFLCALHRASVVELKRFGGLRAQWQRIVMSFPEIGLWRELREQISDRIRNRVSKWDEAMSDSSHIAKPWRDKLKVVLSKDGANAVAATDRDIRQIAAELWSDMADWARNNDAQRHLELFKADGSESSALGKDSKRDPAVWSFLPAADLLLLLCDGLIGITIEGVFLKEVVLARIEEHNEKEEKDKAVEVVDKDKEQKDEKKDPKQEQIDAQRREGFDWEKMWRNKREVQKWRSGQTRGTPSWQRGHSPSRYSRSRSRSRRRRRRSPSRTRRRRSSSRSPRRSPPRRSR